METALRYDHDRGKQIALLRKERPNYRKQARDGIFMRKGSW
jgi:hypothetical protein